jgi:hypothetical protein
MMGMDTNLLSGGGSDLPFGITYGMLFASLLWGSIGIGFCIYGKKQRSAPPWIGGIALIAISYLIRSPLWMSLASVGIIAGIWFWSRYN